MKESYLGLILKKVILKEKSRHKYLNGSNSLYITISLSPIELFIFVHAAFAQKGQSINPYSH